MGEEASGRALKVRALKNEVTRLTGKRPVDAIRERVVDADYSRPVSIEHGAKVFSVFNTVWR